MDILYAAIYRIVEKMDVSAPAECKTIEHNRQNLHLHLHLHLLFDSAATAAIKIAECISEAYSASEVQNVNEGSCTKAKKDALGDVDGDALAHSDDRVNPSGSLPPPHSDVMKEMVDFFIVKAIEGRSSRREFRRRQIHDVGNSVTYHLLLNGAGIGIGVAVATRPNNNNNNNYNADLAVIRFTEQLLYDISGVADGEQLTTPSLVIKSSLLFSTKRKDEYGEGEAMEMEKEAHERDHNAKNSVRVLSLLASSCGSKENMRKDSSEESGDISLSKGNISSFECGSDLHAALTFVEEQLRRNVKRQNNQLNVNVNLQPARSRPSMYGDVRRSKVPLRCHDHEQPLKALAGMFTEVAH